MLMLSITVICRNKTSITQIRVKDQTNFALRVIQHIILIFS